MHKLPNWVLAIGLVVAGCGSPVVGWGDWDGGPGAYGGGGSQGGGGSGDAGSDGGGSSGSSSGASGSGGGAATGDGGPVCTSGVISNINEGSAMTPGEKCVSCHSVNAGPEVPMLTIGGTIYPTAHEPNDCNGASVSGANVVITDANKNVLTIPVDSVGNFFSSASIATPYTASVVYNGNTLSMITPQTSGDCNSCHTESGANGAPGRVMLP